MQDIRNAPRISPDASSDHHLLPSRKHGTALAAVKTVRRVGPFDFRHPVAVFPTYTAFAVKFEVAVVPELATRVAREGHFGVPDQPRTLVGDQSLHEEVMRCGIPGYLDRNDDVE